MPSTMRTHFYTTVLCCYINMQSRSKKVAKVEALFACVSERNHSWFMGWHKWGVSHQLPALVGMKPEGENLLTCPSSLYSQTSALSAA